MRRIEHIECPVCGTEYEAEYETAPASGPAGEPDLDPPVNEYIDPPICEHCGHFYRIGETIDSCTALYFRVGELWREVRDLNTQLRIKNHAEKINKYFINNLLKEIKEIKELKGDQID